MCDKEAEKSRNEWTLTHSCRVLIIISFLLSRPHVVFEFISKVHLHPRASLTQIIGDTSSVAFVWLKDAFFFPLIYKRRLWTISKEDVLIPGTGKLRGYVKSSFWSKSRSVVLYCYSQMGIKMHLVFGGLGTEQMSRIYSVNSEIFTQTPEESE